MIPTSNALLQAWQWCVRKPFFQTSLIFDKERGLDPQTFIACQSVACDPLKFVKCGTNSLAPEYDYLNNVEDRVLAVEIVRECQGLFGGIINSSADVTFTNYDGRYSQYGDFAIKCDGDSVNLGEPLNTSAGIPIRIAGGFEWLQEDCTRYAEANVLFTGITTGFPELVSGYLGRDTARFNATDYITELLSVVKESDWQATNLPITQVIEMLLSQNGINIQILGTSTTNITYNFVAGTTLDEYIQDLLILDMGRLYQTEDGRLVYESGAYKTLNQHVWEYDTWTNVIDLSSQTFTDIVNTVTVKNGLETTDPAYISATVKDDTSISQYGRYVITISNRYITTQAEAVALGNAYLQRYANSSQAREIKTIANPSIQVGDYISLEERFETDTRDGCCKILTVLNKYRVCKIVDSYNSSDGWVQTLNITKDRVFEKFIACESRACDKDRLVAC